MAIFRGHNISLALIFVIVR